MRLLILKDQKITDTKRADKALEKIQKDYGGITPVLWEYQDRNFDNLKWVKYNHEDLGLDFSYIQNQTKVIWETYNEEYDHVIFLVHPDHWRDGGQAIGGWNLGQFYNGFQVQICKFSNSDEWLYKIFAMEIFHSMNDFAIKELGVSFAKVAGVKDFDNEIVHGENPLWGKIQANGTYFTDYKYRPAIIYFGSYIMKFYEKRLQRFNDFISGLEKKLSWLQRLIAWYRAGQIGSKPTPVTIGELEGKVEHNHHH